ncbi:MAG: hypothetical protein IKE81_05315 [Clostridia bacterium]|nr:hypothetical protein [Clostridia bacterium]
MNQLLSKIGAIIVTVTVFLFAVFIVCDFSFGSYFVCMFLPLGYIMMSAGFQHESAEKTKVSANIGLILAGVYAVLILVVYYAQTTTVRLEELSDQAARVLDYRKGGLLFNYDLLGYGIMALSTFFIGLSIQAENKPDLWLKRLMMIHGVFFLSCFFMPMTGMFTHMADGNNGNGGSIALLFWCIYFIPIGLLAYRHFSNKKDDDLK